MREATEKAIPGQTQYEHSLITVRNAECRLIDGRTASCRFEMSRRLLDEPGSARREWQHVSRRFRYLGRRIASSHWYPVPTQACS